MNKNVFQFIFYRVLIFLFMLLFGSNYVIAQTNPDTISLQYFGNNSKIYQTNGRQLMPLNNNGTSLKGDGSGKERNIKVAASFSLNIDILDTKCETNNGTIIIKASNGTAPYQFSISGRPFQSSGRFIKLMAGDYDIVVKDAAGNTVSTTVTLTNTYSMPTGTIVNGDPTDCSLMDGSATITGIGGQPPYLYSMDYYNFQTSNVFNHLAMGWYIYYLKDANGCVASLNNTLPNSTYCSFSADGGGSSTSYCGNTGMINIRQVYGGTPPYSFSMDGIHYQTDKDIVNIPPGVNTLYIKDATGMINIHGMQMIAYCAINLEANATPASCGKNNGTLSAVATKGVPPYTYSVDGTTFQSSNTFTGLTPGNYTLWTEDANGDFMSYPGLVISSGCLSIKAATNDVSCKGNDGKITVTAADGTEPYLYSIDGTSYQSANTFSNLPAGDYTVYVKDAGNDIKNIKTSVTNLQGLSIKSTAIPTSCDASTGSISISVKGGAEPFQYSLDGISYQSDNTFKDLAYGQYHIYSKDAGGCLVENCCTLIDHSCLKVSATHADTKCNQNTGTITISVEYGMAPYQYSINGTNFQTNNSFIKLPAGSYQVTVKDSKDIQGVATVEIGSVCVTATYNTVDALCGTNTGSITITPSGGSSPYKYSIDGVHFQTKNTFTKLVSGKYNVTVKDNNDLSIINTVTIANIEGPQISLNATAATCANNDGSIVANNNNGTSPFSFSLNNNDPVTSGTFTNLSSGTYTVKVEDANKCISTRQITIPLNNDLRVDAGNDITICQGKSVYLSPVSNGSLFSWRPAIGLSNTSIATPVSSPDQTTKYYVDVFTDVCTVTDSLIVFVNPAPKAIAGNSVAICYGKDIQLNGKGGTKFLWQPATYLTDATSYNPIVRRPLTSMTYYLSVTDEYGCESLEKSSVVVTVTPPAKVFAGKDTSMTIGAPLQLNAIDVGNSGFNQFIWHPGFGLSNPNIKNPVATLNADQTFIVTAIAPGGCMGTDTIKIKVYQGPDIYVPTAFTPNGDGLNDLLRVKAIGIKTFKYFALYNRWGQQVFFTSQPEIGWNGKFNETLLGNETFVWMASGIDINGHNINKKGTVLLVR